MNEERKTQWADGESSPDILCWRILFLNRAFRIREISAHGNARLSSLMLGDGDELAVVSVGSDPDEMSEYRAATDWLFESYLPVLNRIYGEFESIVTSFDDVTGPDRAVLADRFEECERSLERERRILDDRIGGLVGRFLDIVDSRGQYGMFLRRRLDRLEEMAKRDERIFMWLRRKRAEWDESGTDDRLRFREADAMLRESVYRDSLYESYREILRRMCRLTASQLNESRMMLTSGRFPTVFITGESSLSMEASAMLRDMARWGAEVDDGIRVSEGDGESFRKMLDFREFLVKTLRFVFV